MPPDRPVRLTFPAREPGARKIMADGIQVGHCLADFRYHWTAYCWSVAGESAYGWRYELTGASLRQMREKVRGWLDENGVWWT